jgi:hypothetical protein
MVFLEVRVAVNGAWQLAGIMGLDFRATALWPFPQRLELGL